MSKPGDLLGAIYCESWRESDDAFYSYVETDFRRPAPRKEWKHCRKECDAGHGPSCLHLAMGMAKRSKRRRVGSARSKAPTRAKSQPVAKRAPRRSCVKSRVEVEESQ